MKRKIFLLFLIFSSFIGVKADEPVRFTATAPSTVILDKPFQLVYTINAQGKDLRVPKSRISIFWQALLNREVQVFRLSMGSEVLPCQFLTLTP